VDRASTASLFLALRTNRLRRGALEDREQALILPG
jgi:hypothetical protein